MSLRKLFADHIRTRQETYARILAATSYDGLVISSGTPFIYFADDREAPFEPTPHFAHWCPDRAAHHLLQIRPGKKPRLLRYSPADFWYEHEPLQPSFWTEEFEIIEVGHKDDLVKNLASLGRHAYIGPPEEQRGDLASLPANPGDLTAALDWERGVKSDYEVQCMSEANRMAAASHVAARRAFAAGGSELEIHQAYLAELAGTENHLPYGTIVGIDAKSAVLHYQNKRLGKGGGVLLIDAGARFNNYAADVTRTYAKRQVPSEFRSLLAGMDTMQQALCAEVRAGVSYAHLHDQSHRRLAAMLIEHKVLCDVSADEAVRRGFTRPFFPHGLGHMLGIQVHDVAGKQKNAQGDPCEAPPEYPALRTARPLREREVITMEPGLYFIDVLLKPIRGTPDGRHFKFELIDELLPWGGIRIEDNLVVGKEASRNLTREVLHSSIFID